MGQELHRSAGIIVQGMHSQPQTAAIHPAGLVCNINGVSMWPIHTLVYSPLLGSPV